MGRNDGKLVTTDLSVLLGDAAGDGEASADAAIAGSEDAGALRARHAELLDARDRLLQALRQKREHSLMVLVVAGLALAAPFVLPMPNVLRLVWLVADFLLVIPAAVFYFFFRNASPSQEEQQARAENERALAAVEAELRAIGRRLEALGAPVDTRIDRV